MARGAALLHHARMGSMQTQWDVAIIGAGAAGLAAASELVRGGRSVVVLEARDRIGGRIFSHQHPDFPYPIELGAEFIHGEAPATMELLRRVRLVAFDTAGSRWTRRGERLEPRENAFGDVARLMRRVQDLPRDISVEEFLGQYAADPALEKARTWARMMVEGFDAADPRRASVRGIAREWSGESLQGQYRPLGGYGAVFTALVQALDPARFELELNALVQEIDWSSTGVRISVQSGSRERSVRARYAIVTLPLAVLQLDSSDADAVRFTPTLRDKRDALAGVAQGPVIKVVLSFRRAWWEELQQGRYADAGFTHSPAEDFPTLWTALPLRLPLLTAWTGGPRAARLADLDAPSLIERALAVAGRTLGSTQAAEREFLAGHVHDWQRDPFARGAYSYVVVGGERAPAALAEPLASTLFFAGEAASADGTGTVEAALQSGYKAARMLLALSAN